MKTQEIVLICRYTEVETSIAQIIQHSFEIFLENELRNVEKRLCAIV